MTVCWKLSLTTCDPQAAEQALEMAGASVTATTPRIDDDSGLYKDHQHGDKQTVEGYFDFEPDITALSAPADAELLLEELPQVDWVSEGQKNLPPVHVPPFHLYGWHDRGATRGAGHHIQMDAGLAFGSGHHGTTQGCLALLAFHLRRTRVHRVADIGCGSGILAIAAAKAGAHSVIASDYDPDSVLTTRTNARLNHVGPQINTLLATGMAHPRLRDGAPFDLIFANILARPLHGLAGQFAPALAPHGRLILSGLLHEHTRAIIARYRQFGLIVERHHKIGEWTSLLLRH